MQRYFIIVLACFWVSMAFATESAFSLTPKYPIKESLVSFTNEGQVIKGILTVPEGKAKPWPAVVLFHGFTDNKHELPVIGTKEGLYDMAARIFAGQGFAVLRIDFRGSGESEGRWEDTCNSGQVSDGLATMQYLSTIADIDQERIAVLGFSQGGLVAACAAGRYPKIKSAILWSPVTYPPLSGVTVFGKEIVEKGLQDRNAVLSITLPWGAQLQLKGMYFQDLFSIDPLAEITQYHGALLVIVGLKDTIVTPQPMAGAAYLIYHSGQESLITLDADHAFNCFINTESVDKLLYWSLNWLEKTLE